MTADGLSPEIESDDGVVAGIAGGDRNPIALIGSLRGVTGVLATVRSICCGAANIVPEPVCLLRGAGDVGNAAWYSLITMIVDDDAEFCLGRSEEHRVGKECRCRW